MSLTDLSQVSTDTVHQKLGSSQKVGTPTSVTVLEINSANDVIFAKGATVPTDTDSGFAKGCQFIKTNGTVATTLYVNEGSETSCDFNAMETSASTITGVIAGAGLTGGGTEGTVTVTVTNTDGNILVTADSTDLALSPNIAANLTYTKEVNHTNTVSTTTTAATVGGNYSAAAGQGATTGAGGVYAAAGGASGVGATGNGGQASVTGGAAASTDGTGGLSKIVGGIGTGTGLGGKAQAIGGVGGATGAGGAAEVTGGIGGATSGSGGAATIAGGAGTNGNATGGVATVTGGAGQGTASGAAATLAGGASGAGATGNGASAQINGGAALSTNGNGGNVILTPGVATGTGLFGDIFLRGPIVKSYTTTAMTDTATISVAGILGGLIKGTPTAAANYTMPTGTVLAAALPVFFTTGDSVEFTITNLAANDAFDITLLTAASGITLLSGYVLVEANSAATKFNFGTFRCVMTGANAFDVWRIA